ncbi:MAG: hypothetical protein ACQETL_10340 [Bacteroidota bacterium]
MARNIFLMILFLAVVNSLYAQDDEEKEKKEFYFNVHANYSISNDYQVSMNQNLLSSTDGEVQTLDLSYMAFYPLIRNYLSLGGGGMLSRSFGPNFNQLWLMGELRGYLSDEPTTIYLLIYGGKSLAVGDFFVNGQGAGIGIGFRFKLMERLFMVDLRSFNRSVQFDNVRFRDSNSKGFLTGAYLGLGFRL